MSYHQICFPPDAVLRLQPRAAGPLVRELIGVVGHPEPIPFTFDRGLLVIDPRYDILPVVGPGWESKTS